MELIEFVDDNGVPTGETGAKLESHHNKTKLHAAFSCYVFNDAGKFLVTKRADSKKVWPGVWTNSVCGHPAPGESREDAVIRRLDFELGMTATNIELVLPKYIYTTPPYNGIIEHEFCPVYIAIATSEPEPNPEEVSEYEWVDWDWYVDQCENDSSDYSDPSSSDAPKWSWWCKDQLKQLRKSRTFTRFIDSF